MNETVKFVKPKMLFLATIVFVGVFGFAFFTKALTACEISCGITNPNPYQETCSDGSNYNNYFTQIVAGCVPNSQAHTYDGECVLNPEAGGFCCANGGWHSTTRNSYYWTTEASCLRIEDSCLCQQLRRGNCSGVFGGECKLIGTSCGSASDCCYGAVCKNGFCGTLGSCLPGVRSCSCNSQCCSGVCSSGQCTGTVTENCTDNIDNDGDLKIDCQDPDCPSSCGSCQTASCSDITHQWTCSGTIACVNGDRCCPAGCVPLNDNDCSPGPCFSYGQTCIESSQCCSNYCDKSVYLNWRCGCKPVTWTCNNNSECCSNYCSGGNCQYTPCPGPSTYCPGQPVFDGGGNSCSAPGTAICDPGPPTSFSHTANTINTITWSWTKPLVGYPYYGIPTKYQIFDSFNNLIADNIPTTACLGTSCSWQETSLSTNTSYTRYAKTCNQTVCSDPSNTASAYTSIQPVATAECSSITINSIQVTAYSAGGLGLSNITYGSSGIRFQRIGFDIGYQKSNSYNFTGLTPSTAYTFTAGPSRNGDNENTAGTANVSCTTATILSAPTNLHHTGNTVDTIDWVWNASVGANYYNIYSRYFRNGNPYWQLKTTISAPAIPAITYHQTNYYNRISDNWPDLTENAMYGLGVAACKNPIPPGDPGVCSGISMADAATSILAPSDIACQIITKTSIRSFAVGTLPNIALGSSGVIFRRLDPPSSQDSQSRYWNLLDLIPNKKYSFYAKARNQDGELSDNEFGPKDCWTLPPTIIPISLRVVDPSGSIKKLALIDVVDAISLKLGTIKVRMGWGENYAAYLVEPTDLNASPVRVMTPMGIKAWRKAP